MTLGVYVFECLVFMLGRWKLTTEPQRAQSFTKRNIFSVKLCGLCASVVNWTNLELETQTSNFFSQPSSNLT